MVKSGLILRTAAIFILFLNCRDVNGKEDDGEVSQRFFLPMIHQSRKNPFVLYNLLPTKILKLGVKTNFTATRNGWCICNNGTRREEVTDPPLVKQNKPILRLKVAALFRDNIIRAFGYILHRCKMELNSALYTSLYFIWNTLKLNQVNIIEMVPILSDLSFKTSHERFLVIFESMEKHLPDYLKCAATVWKEAVQSKEVNMDVIFQPTRNSALVVDILFGMDQEMLAAVASEEAFDKQPHNDHEKDVFYNFNINIVQILRYVQHNKKDIQQVFLGALIKFLPRTLIQPNLEESIELITQYLDQYTIEEWTGYVSKIQDVTIKHPNLLVIWLYNVLTTNSKVPNEIKDSLQIIFDNLLNKNPTAINPHYQSISALVTIDKVDFYSMLKYIKRGIFPMEIVLSATRVSYYLAQKFIRYLSLTMFLNPYQYSSPTELLLAVLIRIIKRQPDLPLEILDSTGAVYSYLLLMYRYIYSPAIMPKDMLTINTLIIGVKAPDKDVSFLLRVEDITAQLQDLKVDFSKILEEKIIMYKCSTPLICFIELLIALRKMKISSPEIDKLIPPLFEFTYVTTACPLDIIVTNTSLFPLKVGECAVSGNRSDCYIELEDRRSTTTTTTTKRTPPTEPIERTKTQTTAAPTEADPPTGPPPTGLTSTIDPRLTVTPDNDTFIYLILNGTVLNETREVRHMKIMIKILKSEEFKMKFNETMHLPTISAFNMVLKEMDKQYVNDTELTVDFFQFLHRFIDTLKHVEAVLKQISVELSPTRPVFIRLLIAVPAPQTDDEKNKFETLKQILSNAKLIDKIYEKLKKSDFINSASLLEAVLKLEVKEEKGLNAHQRDVIKYYIGKIQKLGFGQSKIDWSLNVTTFNQSVDISTNIGNAVDFETLDKHHRILFNNIVRYLKDETRLLATWDKWLYYGTAGEFTMGLFNHILKQPSVPWNIRRAIHNMRMMVNVDGKALKASY